MINAVVVFFFRLLILLRTYKTNYILVPGRPEKKNEKMEKKRTVYFFIPIYVCITRFGFIIDSNNYYYLLSFCVNARGL